MTHSVSDRPNSRLARAPALQGLRPVPYAGIAAIDRMVRHPYVLAGQSFEWTLAQPPLAVGCARWTGIAAGIEFRRALGDQLLTPAPRGSARRAAAGTAVEHAPASVQPVEARA